MTTNTFLVHHGILGMKWGIRRYQNKDGTLTEAGKARNRKKLVESDYSDKVKLARKLIKPKDLRTDAKRNENYERMMGNINHEINENRNKVANWELEYYKKIYEDELEKNPEKYWKDQDKTELFRNIATSDTNYERAQEMYQPILKELNDPLYARYGSFADSRNKLIGDIIAKKFGDELVSNIDYHDSYHAARQVVLEAFEKANRKK